MKKKECEMVQVCAGVQLHCGLEIIEIYYNDNIN
jgi:hypothetical protein